MSSDDLYALHNKQLDLVVQYASDGCIKFHELSR